MTTFFGMLHPLIGSDILASPRTFGPNHILRTCIDFASYLFEGKSSIHLLADKESMNQDAYARFTLALFKKRYANKIKLKAEEILALKLISQWFLKMYGKIHGSTHWRVTAFCRHMSV